jgi:heptosyltransferase-3
MTIRHYHSARKIALIPSTRLGDSLLLMTVAANLQREGRQVAIFSTHINALKRWFAGFDIYPLPSAAEAPQALCGFDVVMQMELTEPFEDLSIIAPHFTRFQDWAHSPPHQASRIPGMHILKEFEHYCRDVFGLTGWDNGNGMQAPESIRAGASHRSLSKQVVIHPGASEPIRCWPPRKFLKLAQKLESKGYTPAFILAKNERAQWLSDCDGQAVTFIDIDSLDGLAAYMYESNWFIGNDSGIGHLASSVGIPTVTIPQRPRNMRRWRPIWAAGVLAKPLWLPLRTWRRNYWRTAMIVRRVEKAFSQLRRITDHAPPN